MTELIAPAPAVSAASAPEHIASEPAATYSAPAPVVERLTLASAVYAALASVTEFIAPALAVSAAPAPVVVHIAPEPDAIYAAQMDMNLVRFRADGFEMSAPVVGHMSPPRV